MGLTGKQQSLLEKMFGPQFGESGASTTTPKTAQPGYLATVLNNARDQNNINQIRGVTQAGSTGSGIPKHVTNVSASVSSASTGSTSKITISFRRDPTDGTFAGVTVYAKGYQGNQSPTQVGFGTDAPLTIVLNNTGESVSLIVQATGNGGSAPMSTAPSCGVKLPANPNGGFGTSTTTNLTLAQIPTSGATSGSLSVAIASAPATVNLTTEGTFDWFIANGINVTAGQVDPTNKSFIWKVNGGGLLFRRLIGIRTTAASPTIANATTGGSVAFTATAGDAACGAGISTTVPPSSFSPEMNWNGTSVSGTQCGFGFQFPVESNSQARTLRLYIGGGGSSTTGIIQVTAHLMDGSATDQVVTQSSTLSGAAGPGYKATINFKSANPTILLVTALITTVGNAGYNGQLSLFGATLA